MILISSTQIDPVTNNVIEWIRHFDPDRKVIRINDDKGYMIEFKGNQIFIVVNGERIDLDAIEAFWYRRGRIRYAGNRPDFLQEVKEREIDVLEEYLNYRLSRKKFINHYFESEPNKLVVNEEAKACGLLVPESYLFDNRDDLRSLAASQSLITKNFLGASVFDFSDTSAVLYTQPIDADTDLPLFFSPSLVQENIAKKYELRIFYFKGHCWSTAIFSQQDEQTKADFRIYNHERPNRTAPFELPEDIRSKLDQLMQRLRLDCGSIDMIVTPDNEFVFLEVNPIGQFGMVSYPCNYGLEQEIARYLCS